MFKFSPALADLLLLSTAAFIRNQYSDTLEIRFDAVNSSLLSNSTLISFVTAAFVRNQYSATSEIRFDAVYHLRFFSRWFFTY
ncbi:hypothetical protein TNCT_115031 [Trichonephila clavata]|uniref:Secreted protein n=1 Tax=Trichonephila clavata TaxID=2740835 RepID=A0A8X6LS90_TRICU|nr:hypothetical protein TNCT_115031 [Trichonephila clavata]